MIKRIFDLILVLCLLPILLLPMIIIVFIVKFTSKGDILHWSKRVGKNNRIFLMPKFRSMKMHTPNLATHLLPNVEQFLTPVGSFLRQTSLDELPQLFLVLIGKMSFVGPRPALFTQEDLIALRKKKGIDKLLPGITGWAQINGRDNISIFEKVSLDEEYLNNQSFIFDLKILCKTLIKVLKRNNISH
jgi:O-antigen biosynthesis protein WbqP